MSAFAQDSLANDFEDDINVWNDESNIDVSLNDNFRKVQEKNHDEDFQYSDQSIDKDSISYSEHNTANNIWASESSGIEIKETNNLQSQKQEQIEDQQNEMRNNSNTSIQNSTLVLETVLTDDADFDDGFGEFEEITSKRIAFNKSQNDILAEIFDNQLQEEQYTDTSKSILLIDGGNKPMKSYNTLIADNRQFLSDEIPIINLRQRGCIEQLATHKTICNIANEWIYEEKGIKKGRNDNDNDNVNKDSKLLGTVNIFRWSTKVEIEKIQEPVGFTIGKRLIGQKLLNAAHQEARKIVDIRLENEKHEQMVIEKMRWDREQKLKKEEEKRIEERERYKTENIDVDQNKKKRGFFGKMFQSKSKISKDHISHKKLINESSDQLNEPRELSLKEQVERDGYEFSSDLKGKKKFIKRKGGGDNDSNADDDDDDDDDDDADEFAPDFNGYNVLDSTVNANLYESEIFDNNVVEPTGPVLQQEEHVNNVNTDQNISDFDNFGDFAPVEPPVELEPKKIENSDNKYSFDEFGPESRNASEIIPQVITPKSVGNLIDL